MTDESSENFSVGPRVMRHAEADGGERYAVHEAYFDSAGRVVSWTEDALSPRETAVAALEAALQEMLNTNREEIITGDLNYVYAQEDIQEWLEHIKDAPVDYH